MLQAAAGLLRLARAGLREEVCQAESAHLRDAPRRLSDLREAEALLETYDKRGARFADERRLIAPYATGRRRVRRARQGAGGTLPRLPAQSAERGGG
jgi:hypothetical protein